MGSRLLVLALAFAAAACAPATEGRTALAEATGIDRVLMRGTVRWPQLLEEPYTGYEPRTDARNQVVGFASRLFGATDAVVEGQYRGTRSRILSLDPPSPVGAEGVTVELVLEGPDLLAHGGPALPSELHDVPLWPHMEGSNFEEVGPHADFVLERAPALPAARPFDALWSDGILEVSVFFQTADAFSWHDAAFALGEAFERWGLTVQQGRGSEWIWSRTYEGTTSFDGGEVRLKAEITALRASYFGEEVPAEGREASEAYVRALATASTRDVVLFAGELLEHPEGATLDRLVALVARDRDQAILIDDPDPVLVASALSRVARSSGKTLWVAGTYGSAVEPIGPLQLLGPLLAPGDPARHPSIADVPWELLARSYHASFELVGGAP